MMMNIEKPRYLTDTALLIRSETTINPRSGWRSKRAYAEQYVCAHLYPLVRLTHGQVLASANQHEEVLAEYAIAEETARTMNLHPILWQTCAAASCSLLILGHDVEATQKQTNHGQL